MRCVGHKVAYDERCERIHLFQVRVEVAGGRICGARQLVNVKVHVFFGLACWSNGSENEPRGDRVFVHFIAR